jgi:hypothetical protein
MNAAVAASATPQARSRGRAEQFAPILTGLLLAVPVVAFRYPPMVDLPMHEAVVGVLRGFHDPALFPKGLYVLNLGHSNQLFYFVAYLLSWPFGVEMACKLVVGITLFALPMAMGHLADHVGASRWATLLIGPVALGWLFMWGLINNLLGLAALLAMLPVLDHFADDPTPRRAAAALGGAVLLYETHELMLVLYGGAALIFAAGHAPRLRATLLRTAPFTLAVGLSIVDHLWSSRLAPPIIERVPIQWAPLSRKVLTIPGVILGGHEGEILYSITAITAAVIALFLVARLRAPTDPIPRAPRAFIHRYRFELFGAACLVLYLAVPFDIHGATMVYHRFAAPAYAVLVVCAAKNGGRGLPRVTPIVTAAVPLSMILVVWPAFVDASRSAKDLDTIAARIVPGSSIAQLDFPDVRHPASTSDAFIIASLASSVLAHRGGRLLFSFMESPIAPVMFDPRYEWDEPIKRMLPDHFALRPAHDFTRFRYLVMYTKSAGQALATTFALIPEARFVDSVGDWLLFESTLDVAPLMSHDTPLPVPHPNSLRARLRKLSEAVNGPLEPSDVPPEPTPNKIRDDAVNAATTPK